MNWAIRNLILECTSVAALVTYVLAPAGAQTRKLGPGLTMQGPPESSNSAVIRNALGKPCLDIEAAARAHVIDRDMLDHVVSVKNNCPRTIKVKVCYFDSDACNVFDIQAYKRVDTILGTMRKVSNFRYTITQK